MGGKQYFEAYFTPERYRELDIRYNPEQKALWCYKRYSSRPCCTPGLFAEMLHLHRAVEHYLKFDAENDKRDALQYLVIASQVPGVFNLGGDLGLLLRLIRTDNHEELYNYAKACVDIVYVSYHLPITTISLVQGDALGGGFEGALVSQVIIAERQAKMGLPEVLFNFFPGVSAYSLLARRLDSARAERIILSGRVYSAEELHELGVVDVLAENGEGESAVNAYIKKRSRASNSYRAIQKVRKIYQPLPYDELLEIAKIWLEAALRLNERDLRIMERLAQSQEKVVTIHPPEAVKQLA